jgi:hypothetical protein
MPHGVEHMDTARELVTAASVANDVVCDGARTPGAAREWRGFPVTAHITICDTQTVAMHTLHDTSNDREGRASSTSLTAVRC